MSASKESLRYKFLGESEVELLKEQNPRLRTDPSKYCPTCGKKGQFFWQDRWNECDCQLQLQLHKHYLKAGIGLSYQRLSWDDYYGDPEVKKKCEEYIEQHEHLTHQGMGIMLLGSLGTGKTMAISLLLKELIWLGYDCYSTTFTSMIEMFTSGWKSEAEQRRFQDRIKRSEVLLLDDIGKEMRTKTNLAESTFDDVLRSRVQSGRPTFITSNLELSDLSEGYGSAVLSLLKEVSIVRSIDGADFRLESNKRRDAERSAGNVRPIQ